MPVRDVGERRGDVGAQPVAHHAGAASAPHAITTPTETSSARARGGGRAAPRTDDVEPAWRSTLNEQEARDQVAAEDEEDVDAEEAGVRSGHAEVERHHRRDGDGAETVEGVVALGLHVDRNRTPGRLRAHRC